MSPGRLAGDRGWTGSPIGVSEWDQIEHAVGASVPPEIRNEFALVAGGWRFNADRLLSLHCPAATWAAPGLNDFLTSIVIVECGCDGFGNNGTANARVSATGSARGYSNSWGHRSTTLNTRSSEPPGRSTRPGSTATISRSRSTGQATTTWSASTGRPSGPASAGPGSPILDQEGMVARGHVGFIGQERGRQLLPARSRWFLLDVDCAGGRVELGEYRYSWTITCPRPSAGPPISAQARRPASPMPADAVRVGRPPRRGVMGALLGSWQSLRRSRPGSRR
jgi:hypothetical protein